MERPDAVIELLGVLQVAGPFVREAAQEGREGGGFEVVHQLQEWTRRIRTGSHR